MNALAFTRGSLLAAILVSTSVAANGADQATLTAERDAAIEQVKRIVNQPVQAVPLSTDVHLGRYAPGWFHEGAARPDFLRVDVSQSQQFPFDKFEFVTSDITPGVMYRSRDLEFNANTKFFYTDRTVPKKRLTPEEMAEINRLYRVIGERERDLPPPPLSPTPPIPALPSGGDAETSPAERRTLLAYAAGGVVAAALAIGLYRMFAARS